MFQANHACRTQDKNRHKIVPGACRTELPTKIVLKTRFGTLRAPFWRGLGHSWAPLGRHLASFGALLGGSWPLLGAPWAHLGRFLGALGRLLVGLGWILGTFWLLGALQASILEGFGGVSGWVLEALRAMFRRSFLYDLTVVAPCFYLRSNHALSFTCAFGASPPVRRSVHRTSAASRRESRACQTVIPSSPLLPASKACFQN